MNTPSSLRPLSVFATIAAIFTSTAQAILDTNNNSISDLFERQYNNGNLFLTTFLATNDDDKDGWSNAKEATAGTNPFDPNPPDGIVALTITPSLIEGAFTLSWNTLVGKNYQLKVSTDLVNWSNLGAPITTIQNTHTIGVNTTQPDFTIPPTVFWQITVTDLDTDNDGLTNAEEHILGTDPFLDDTDGDTLNDKAEILANTNPLSNDTDLDGIPDNLDATPLINNVIANPDHAGLSATLLNGLTSLWDFETLQTLTINGIPTPAYANLINPAQPAQYYGPLASDDGLISRSAHYQTATHSLIAPPQVFSGKTNWSIAFWYKIAEGSIQNKAGTLNTVFWAYNNGNGSNNNDTTPEFQVHAYKALTPTASQKLIISHYHNGTLQPDLVTDIPQSNPLDNDTWQHLTITKQNGTIKLYRNAVLLNQFSTSAASYTATSTGYFALGRLHQSTTADTALRGKLDRFTIHNRALSAAEVTAIVDLDSDKDGLYDRVETATKLWRDANSNGIVDPGETTYQCSPYHAQPSGHDSDRDGLTNLQEQTLGTEISDPDTDGDLIPDGYEHIHGLNPLDSGDGAIDSDGDGLSNIDEYRNNTDPQNEDTDGDGIHDGPEVKGPDGNLITDDGSDPNDISDGGTRRPNDQLVTFKLGVGDRSGSQSEDYVLNVFRLNPETGVETRVFTLRSGGFGQYIEYLKAFKKGNCYSFQLDWQGTNNQIRNTGGGGTSEGPDFDYHMVVEPQGSIAGTVMMDSFDTTTKKFNPAVKLLDPQDILATDDDDDDISNLPETLGPLRVVFISYDITKIFSNQINGNKANFLPTAFYKGAPNNPMLAGASFSNGGEIFIETNLIPQSLARYIYAGVRKVGSNTIARSMDFDTLDSMSMLFSVENGSAENEQFYEVVAGLDADASYSLSNDEVGLVFEKTPKTDSAGAPLTTPTPHLDKIIVVTQNDYNAAKSDLIFNNLWGTDYAGDLISAFAQGHSTVDEGTTTSPHPISSTQPGLSHPVGARWDTANNAETHRVTWYNGSEIVSDLNQSNALSQVLGDAINLNLAAIKAATPLGGAWGNSGTYSFNISRNLITTEEEWVGINELGYTFGKIDFIGSIAVSSRWVAGGKIEVGTVTYNCQIDDIYDFTYWGGSKARQASMVQAGHATLTGTGGLTMMTSSGKVFYTRVIWSGSKAINIQY